MNRSLDDSANPGDEIHLPGDGHDAGGGAHYVDHVTLFDAGANGIPVSIESAHWNRDSGLEAQLFSPAGSQPAGQLIRCPVTSRQLLANPRKQGIDLDQKLLRR